MSERIAITTFQMKELVNTALRECASRHPSLYVDNYNLLFDWKFGRMNGKAILRVLQDKYGWEGHIPLVRQPTPGERLWYYIPRHHLLPRNEVHDGQACIS